MHSEVFVSFSNNANDGTPPRMLLIPVLFRCDPNPDANNNSRSSCKIFGSPWLVRIPSTLPASEFQEFISDINPFPEAQTRVLVMTWDVSLFTQDSKLVLIVNFYWG